MITRFDFGRTALDGLVEVTPFDAEDLRGRFTKDYSRKVFRENGILHDLAEVFYTTSHRGVVRALHFQRVRQQPKLVRCIAGRVWDAVVDLRAGSPTFGKWLSFELSGENRREILIPGGFAHGYLVLEESIVSYKCAEDFSAEYDDGIAWNDPDIGVAWPLEEIGGAGNVILAEKDRSLQSFAEFRSRYGGLE